MTGSAPVSLSPLLIANRGEIAVRVQRTAHRLGYRTVAVHSDADAGAPHVAMADRAVRIGPAPARDSYLSVERILEAARVSGARAVHPGYGFLSENAAFARACEEAGLVFVGPPPAAIEAMGDKGEAKRRMIAAGVPCVPGFQEAGASDQDLLAAAEEIGYPIMVKAAAGGGGRGMRLVRRAEDLAAAIRAARAEALSGFGSDELILERALERPRHVEIQVLADAHGAVIHLGERDCSVQRRHQKVIEESPCPVLTEELRARMGEAAVAAARSIGYRGAGTVELLLDEDGAFYFLEMNTRLQVEHPVTEAVTGLDLVELQLAVAEGRPLPLRQQDVRFDGHAIEVRLYAEDPSQGFLPASGRLLRFSTPDGGDDPVDGLRVDAGVRSGQWIPPDYDPMIAKLIAWGADREQARRRLVAALERTAVFGVASNRGFLIECLEAEPFAAGEATTAFLDRLLAVRAGSGGAADAQREPPAASAELGSELSSELSHELVVAAAVLRFLAARDAAHRGAVLVSPTLLDWGSSGLPRQRRRLATPAGDAELAVAALGGARYRVEGRIGSREVAEEVEVLARGAAPDGLGVELRIGDRRRRMLAHVEGDRRVHLCAGAVDAVIEDRTGLGAERSGDAGGGRVTAPMHGSVVEVFVAVGDSVAAGARIATVEAMKMQHELLAEVAGTVTEVSVEAGRQVAAGDLIAVIEPSSDQASVEDDGGEVDG